MRSFTVSVTVPEWARHPMHGLIDDNEAVHRSEMLEWNVTDEDRIALLFRVVADREVYETALREVDTVHEYELVDGGDGDFYLYVRDRASASDRELYDAFSGTGLVTVPPVTFGPDGRLTMQVLGDGDDVETVVSEFPDGFGVELETVTSMRPVGGRARLTDRQREALAAAESVGYYELPRDGGVADVADELGVSPSTAGDHLRKAEAALVGHTSTAGYRPVGGSDFSAPASLVRV